MSRRHTTTGRKFTKVIGALAIAVTALALSTGVANAGVRFSDGSYASVHFECSPVARTISLIPDFGLNTTEAHINYSRYFNSTRSYAPWNGWTTLYNQALGAPVSTSVHPGWFAIWTTYGKYVGGRWEHHEEWATIYMNGGSGHWCYMG